MLHFTLFSYGPTQRLYQSFHILLVALFECSQNCVRITVFCSIMMPIIFLIFDPPIVPSVYLISTSIQTKL